MNWDNYFQSLSKNELIENIKEQQLNLYYEFTNCPKTDNIPKILKNPTFLIIEGISHVNLQTLKFDDIWNQLTENSLFQIKQFTKSLYYKKKNDSIDIINIYPGFYLAEEGNHTMRIFFRIYSIYETKHFLSEFRKFSRYHCILQSKCDELVLEFCKRKAMEHSIIKIQKACHNWLWKPICNDGLPGINARIGWQNISFLLKQYK